MYYKYIIRRGPRKAPEAKARINGAIRVPEVRLIDDKGNNVGVVKTRNAVEQAKKVNLDLVEISPKAKPPVVQITDFGKYQYEQKKLKKKWAEADQEKGKKSKEETKQIQIKPGTSGGMLEHRGKKIREWLDDENKVQVDLFLFGRYKGMDKKFLQTKLIEFLKSIEGEVYAADKVKKSPKGFSVVLQKEKGKSAKLIDKAGENEEIMAIIKKEEDEE